VLTVEFFEQRLTKRDMELCPKISWQINAPVRIEFIYPNFAAVIPTMTVDFLSFLPVHGR
jgi:hypothetical protein